MPNLLDHVCQFGDVPFETRPFDDLDSMVLTQVVYMPMEGLDLQTDSATLAEVRAHIDHTWPEKFADPYQRKRRELTNLCAEKPRYAGIRLFRYVNHIDPKQETQFCACTFLLPGDERYVAFRGTDLTIAGWKEDLNMSFQKVPAQSEAVDYVQTAASFFGGKLMLGGHSKGGHLAVYAACNVTAETQDRLKRVYSFDGPGVDQETLDGEGYARIRDRIDSYIPQSSVVGMLLCYHPVYRVVKSNSIGLLQHDVLTWQIRDGAFELLHELDLGTRMSDEALRLWIDRLSLPERRMLTDTVFGLISTLDPETVDPLVQDLPRSSMRLFSAFRRLEPDVRTEMRRMLGELFSSGASEAARMFLTVTFRVFGELPPVTLHHERPEEKPEVTLEETPEEKTEVTPVETPGA